MKILQINSCNFGSTGGIMIGISDVAKSNFEVYTACSNSRSNKRKRIDNQIFIGSLLGKNLHMFLSKFTGFNGCFSILDTYLFLKKLNRINPDIIHLHNLHGWYINLPMLFSYIKKNNIKTIWTLHDCWAFTGDCSYFDIVKCRKWKTGCFNCPQIKKYPESYVDRTKMMYKFKKKWFTGVKNLTVVTPSKWLASLVKESFLNEYNVKVINNGIDLSVFKPTESKLREKLRLENKTVLLGCASPFDERKGFDVFLKLAEKLNDSYKIILVGLSKEQIDNLPDNIIGIERTSSKEELAKFYTMADIFINPTREDNFPTVNIESLACGTPVITFDTGGSPESLDETCGVVVPCDDIEKLYETIVSLKKEMTSKVACINRSKKFDMYDKFKEYIYLYNN